MCVVCGGTCLCLEVGGKLVEAGSLLPPRNSRNHTQAMRLLCCPIYLILVYCGVVCGVRGRRGLNPEASQEQSERWTTKLPSILLVILRQDLPISDCVQLHTEVLMDEQVTAVSQGLQEQSHWELWCCGNFLNSR